MEEVLRKVNYDTVLIGVISDVPNSFTSEEILRLDERVPIRPHPSTLIRDFEISFGRNPNDKGDRSDGERQP